MTTTMRPGTYYVGDPCYALKQEDYDVFLKQCIAGDSCLQGAFVLPNNHRICVLSTLWGDGIYPSSIGVDFSVDAGCISAIPWEAVDQDKLTAGGGINYLGAKVEFEQEFECSSDCGIRAGIPWDYAGGRLTFGHVVINTNPSNDDEEES
jgi:hypothetical protein